MVYEYTKLTYPEAIYGKKNLLYSQLSLLTSFKNLDEYKKLREQEFFLKITLKKKLKEIHDAITKLQKTLPVTKIEGELEEEETRGEREKEMEDFGEFAMEIPSKKKEAHKKRHKSTIDQELNEIRRKIESLG